MDTDDTLGVIEVAAAVLVRNFELLRRRTPAPVLDRSEYLLLRTLDATGPADICGLAAALGLDPSTVGRQVAAMAGKSLVARRPSDTDRRRSIVSPTQAGLTAMETVRAERRAGTAELLAGWSDADLRTLAEMFTRYNRAVAEHHLIEPATTPKPAVDALLPAM
ncbi:MarR family winged helix-turn-helix transcriptional regulator [Labedaea rhizosphaerae]|uniref:DNA-binding MarR family transcriptional regulator n=1 Tax=Labedaea rhizosphaerae TaxID=598644 RepID=A0A4R6S9T6_LABRH|nr:MarR family transcriptional regulator [Labedaea rhizosphaerae]TDP96660.1 DNA-binding MarR family transcriptional regulator [Labedaea rhizosphaerae]